MILGADPEERADRLASLFVVAGVLTTPFYTANPLGISPRITIAVLCLTLALAWRSTLRRGWLWADPATLTWADFDGSRPHRLARRCLLGWVARFAMSAYFTGVSALWIGVPPGLFPAVGLLFVSVAALALAMARRVGTRWAEPIGPLLLAVLGVVELDPRWLWVAAGVAAIARVGGTSLARTAGRADLVRRFHERMVRRTSAMFLDVWSLFPAARPLRRNLLAGRGVVARYLVAGWLGRAHAYGLPVFLLLTVAALHGAFPSIGPIWWTGIGGYLATVPFAAPLARLNQVPGLRRWLGCTDRTLHVTAAALLLLPAGVFFGAAVLAGVPFSPGAVLTVPVVALAVVRSVTRASVDFGNQGLVSIEGVLIPVGLFVQLVRGPDLLVLALGLLGLLG